MLILIFIVDWASTKKKWYSSLAGCLNPYHGQQTLIIVVIDYFSKYVEAKTLTTTTKIQVMKVPVDDNGP